MLLLFNSTVGDNPCEWRQHHCCEIKPARRRTILLNYTSDALQLQTEIIEISLKRLQKVRPKMDLNRVNQTVTAIDIFAWKCWSFCTFNKTFFPHIFHIEKCLSCCDELSPLSLLPLARGFYWITYDTCQSWAIWCVSGFILLLRSEDTNKMYTLLALLLDV